jgi:general secretion pathway protein D
MMRKYHLPAMILGLFLLAACDSDGTVDSFRANDPQDRYQNLERKDYRDLTNPISEQDAAIARVTAQLGAPPIPDVADILAAPRPPKLNKSKRVSVAVTEDVPIRDVLFELARLAEVDIEIGRGIEGGINFRATKKPFNQVIERIANLAGLRYNLKGGILRVERDMPYIKNYPLDFLNMVRSSESSVTLNTDILASTVGGGGSGGSEGGSGGSGGGGSGGSGGSQGLASGTSSSITASSESDLWTALDASISEILNYSPQLAGKDDTPAASSGNAGYVVNRHAGVLSANATERQHDLIERFLRVMRRNISAQVIIEAKILEVTLNDGFRTGINWDGVLNRADLNVNFQPSTTISATSGFTFGLKGGTSGPTSPLEDIINITQEFGTTRTLSSPRLHAVNNQLSVLTFAQNRIFFTCNQTQANSATTGGGGATTTTGSAFTCDRGVVPIGIILSIMPSINLETQEVTLSVRPSLSRQVDTVDDPGTAIAAASNGITLQSAIPVVEVRELDSVMKIKNGGVMVIGGLLEDVSTNQHNGVPILGDVPLLGNLFKSRNEQTSKRELIIFIKATIVDSSGHYVPADKRAYEKFGTDARPLDL